MNPETQKLIDDRIAVLPENIRESIRKIDWGKDIVEIGKKNGLHMEQMGDLQLETVLVLVGLSHPNDYGLNLKRALGTNDLQTTAIVADVNEKILKSVRQDLIDFMAKEDAQVGDPLQQSGVEIMPDTRPAEQTTPIAAPTSSYEKNLLEKSGVELTSEIKLDTPPLPPEERTEMLQDIEHPPKTPITPLSKFVEVNRSGVQVPAQKTNYKEAAPSTGEPVPPTRAPGADPYREPI